MGESSFSRKITVTGVGEIFPFNASDASQDDRRFALLVFCDGEAQMRALDAGATIVVGREAPSEIVVNDPSVSRQHARFLRTDDVITVEFPVADRLHFASRPESPLNLLECLGELELGGARI